jgi:hypothetical protein
MFLIIDGERRGIFIGTAKLRTTRRVGDKCCTGVTSPSPQRVKDGLLLANILCLVHLENSLVSQPEDMKDTAMEVI